MEELSRQAVFQQTRGRWTEWLASKKLTGEQADAVYQDVTRAALKLAGRDGDGASGMTSEEGDYLARIADAMLEAATEEIWMEGLEPGERWGTREPGADRRWTLSRDREAWRWKLGVFMQFCRERAGLTREAVCTVMSLSTKELTGFEEGKGDLDALAALRMLELYRTSPEEVGRWLSTTLETPTEALCE